MKLVEVKAENFKNYKTLNINFDNLDKVNFIVGPNGAGKSTILDTICFALYGETLLGNKGDDVINKRVSKGLFVSLIFNLNNDTYTIERYRKHSKNKNKVLLFKNGDEITKPNIKETNKYIVDLLGIDIDTFRSVISFNSSSSETFVNATDKGKKEFLEHLLNIDIFDKALEKTKDIYKESKDLLDKDNQELKSLEDKNDLANQMINNYNISLESWKVNVNRVKKSLNNEEETLNRLSKTSDDILNRLNSELLALQKDDCTYDSKLYEDTLKEVTKLKAQKNNILNDFNKVKEDFAKNKQDYNQIKNAKNAVCLYCGNVLDAEHKQKELTRLHDLIIDDKNKGESLKKQGTEVVSKLTNLTKDLERLKKEKDLATTKQREHSNKLLALNNEINKEKNKDIVFSNQENKVSMLKQQLADLENNKPIEPSVSLYDDSIDKLCKKIEEDTNKLDVLQEVKDLFNGKGLKNAYISSSLPIINSYLNDYLKILSDDEIACSILSKTTDSKGNTKDKVYINIDYPTRGSDINFDDLSSGEKRIVTLSILLAFNKYFQRNNSIKILLLDEVFDTLSNNRIDNVLTLLDTIKDDYDFIFVISHLTSLKDSNFKRITIEHDVDNNSIINI